MANICATEKIAYHRERLESFLRGEPVFPITIEMDITTQCTRTCPGCPSARGSRFCNMDPALLERLLACVEGRTRGLLLSGGEPTMSPAFPEVLRQARRYGFEEITVVTNGMRLDDERVVAALIGNASAVRVSLYDWSEDGGAGPGPTLERIRRLRQAVDHCSSAVEIGVSVLTGREVASRLADVTAQVRDAGAHWIYFHPLCDGWGTGHLTQRDQVGVVEEIARLRTRLSNGFEILVCPERYATGDVCFDEYYAAHFLLVVGADGKNYLSTEGKYQPDRVIWDLGQEWRDDFLWRDARAARIRQAGSRNYPGVGGRHRGVLYNGLVQDIKDGRQQIDALARRLALQPVRFPHVL